MFHLLRSFGSSTILQTTKHRSLSFKLFTEFFFFFSALLFFSLSVLSSLSISWECILQIYNLLHIGNFYWLKFLLYEENFKSTSSPLNIMKRWIIVNPWCQGKNIKKHVKLDYKHHPLRHFIAQVDPWFQICSQSHPPPIFSLSTNLSCMQLTVNVTQWNNMTTYS